MSFSRESLLSQCTSNRLELQRLCAKRAHIKGRVRSRRKSRQDGACSHRAVDSESGLRLPRMQHARRLAGAEVLSVPLLNHGNLSPGGQEAAEIVR
jgi:hypothetical protein